MPSNDRENAVLRRLREIQEEERRLRQHIREVNRALRRLERGEPTDLPIPAAAVSTPAPSAPAAWPKKSGPALQGPPVSGTVSAPARVGGGYRDQRFFQYLSTGSFGAARPLARERRIQRNKAIFLLLIAGLLGYLVYRLLF